jgi:hypothetical protein
MVDIEQVRALALSLPDTEELPHFGMPSFRWHNKIFSTLRVAEEKVMVIMSLADQSVFCAYDSNIFYPVPGAWGTQGCTFIELKFVDPEMLRDAMHCAYDELMRKHNIKGKKK